MESHAPGDFAMSRSDLDIRCDVQSELQWHPEIDDSRIGVIVTDGIVTLSGEVPCAGGRWAAQNITKRVDGVRAIANEIEVQTPFSGAHSDTEIAESAAAALRRNVVTATTAVTPVVKQGRVTLSGHVTWGFQRRAAERAIRPLPGITHITNDIVVTSVLNVNRVKQDIEHALWRHTRRLARAINSQVH
jgi:osmotically-inducible protein OsmY